MMFWILQTGEPLHCDGGSPRPMRAMNLADALVARGHRVTVWSSAYYHQEKRSRSIDYREIVISDSLVINLIPSPGYSRNIGVGRLVDHFVLGRNLRRALNNCDSPRPDAIFVGFPPIEAAATMVDYAVDRGIPVVVDAKDQWPHIFVEPFLAFLRPLVRIALWPYFYLARRSFRRATAFCSMSEEFLEWMCAVAGRAKSPADFAAALTSPERQFSAGELDAARLWWGGRGVDLNCANRVVFVGSFSSAFDFSVISELSRRVADLGLQCQFVVCGDGGQSANARALLGGCANVVLPGWIDAPKIHALFGASVALIAPYRTNDAFSRSVPNKIIDALSFGCAVLATLDGKTKDLVAEFELGRCSNEIDSLFQELVKLLTDRTYQLVVSKNARRIYLERFSCDVVYGGVVDRLVQLGKA